MEELATVYARSLFEAAHDADKLDERARASSASSPTPSTTTATCRSSSSRPTSRRTRRRTALQKAVTGADDLFVNFLEPADREPADAGAAAHPARVRPCCGSEENKLLPVSITSAVELDDDDRQAASATRSPSRPAEGRALPEVDPDVLGGLVVRVGNTVLDASVRNRLETLRREVVRGAEEPSPCRSSPTRSPRSSSPASRASTPTSPTCRGRHRPLRRRRHRPRPRARRRHVVRDARAPARRDGAHAQPRVRQRRRRAVRRLDEDRRGRHASSAPAACSRSPSATSCSAASSTRSAGRWTARATSRPRARAPAELKAPGVVAAPAGQGADADGHQGDRLDDPDRPRPARADHRRPPDRQDDDRDRHDHQQQGHRRHLGLRRDRPAHGDGGRPRQDARGRRRARQRDHRRRPGRRGRADQVPRARTRAARWPSTSSTRASTR